MHAPFSAPPEFAGTGVGNLPGIIVLLQRMLAAFKLSRMSDLVLSCEPDLVLR